MSRWLWFGAGYLCAAASFALLQLLCVQTKPEPEDTADDEAALDQWAERGRTPWSVN